MVACVPFIQLALALEEEVVENIISIASALLDRNDHNEATLTTSEAITILLVNGYDVLGVLLGYRGDIMQVVATMIRKVSKRHRKICT